MIGRPELRDLEIALRGRPCRLSAWVRRANGPRALVWLHGAGGTKEELFDLVHEEALSELTLAGFDLPGCGRSAARPDLTIDDLVEAARGVLSSLKIPRAILAGHSMGGLTALLFAHRHPEATAGFINIEGNLAPEDCFFSREAINDDAATDPRRFVRELAARLALEPRRGYALYASRFAHNFEPAACVRLFRSIVEHSEGGDLLGMLLSLKRPAAFIHGDENRGLSYLPRLKEAGLPVVEIPRSGHFPMLTNPAALLDAVAELAVGMAVGAEASPPATR